MFAHWRSQNPVRKTGVSDDWKIIHSAERYCNHIAYVRLVFVCIAYTSSSLNANRKEVRKNWERDPGYRPCFSKIWSTAFWQSRHHSTYGPQASGSDFQAFPCICSPPSTKYNALSTAVQLPVSQGLSSSYRWHVTNVSSWATIVVNDLVRRVDFESDHPDLSGFSDVTLQDIRIAAETDRANSATNTRGIRLANQQSLSCRICKAILGCSQWT